MRLTFSHNKNFYKLIWTEKHILSKINNTSESGSHAQVFQDELTAPSAAVLSSLALDVQANDDQVTISWSVPKEIA